MTAMPRSSEYVDLSHRELAVTTVYGGNVEDTAFDVVIRKEEASRVCQYSYPAEV